MEGQRQGLSRVSGTSRGVSLKKSQLRTKSLIFEKSFKKLASTIASQEILATV